MNSQDFQEMARLIGKGGDVDQEELVEALSYAGTAWYEIQLLTRQLCAGYRSLMTDIARKNRIIETLNRTIGDNRRQIEELKDAAKNQWSEGAALGYAVMGLRQAGFSPKDAICVLEAMEDAMQIYDLTAAAEAHQALVEDPGRLPRGGSGPEWIGASAELKPEVPE